MERYKIFKIWGLILIDAILINLAYLIGFYARFSEGMLQHLDLYAKFLPVILVLYIIPMWFMKCYRSIWDVSGIYEAVNEVIACTIGYLLSMIVANIISPSFSKIIITLAYVFTTIFVIVFRLFLRVRRRLEFYQRFILSKFNKKSSIKDRENVLIIGAGSCGRIIINEIVRNDLDKYKVVGFIDDDINKIGTYLSGVPVIGDRNKIKEIVKNEKVNLIIISIPSLNSKSTKEIISICEGTNKKVKIIPPINELIGQDINLTKMRDVDLKELLGRDEIKLDKEGIKDYITDKVVLVTGGGGSIGSELCRQIAQFNPKLLIIVDIYENNAYDLQQELSRNFKNINKEVIIASVRDKRRLDNIFAKYKPDVVFHAAAHKHVPLMEDSPEEAIKNNVKGTLNVAEVAHKHNVKRFVLISTDKAVNPTNVMGASKRLCEIIVQAINKKSNTDFVAVRFGNVLGSNGSVIPLFKKQIKEGGPVTLTHKEIIRYFMLIPEAAQLVLQAGAFAKGGEIFVLDMGEPVRIYDLAKKLISLSGYTLGVDMNIKIVGLRPGEKLYEELLMDEEGLEETSHEKIFIGKPGNFNLDEVKEQIDKLMEITKLDNIELLKSKLEEIVPTYKRLDKEISNNRGIEESAKTILN